MGDPPDAIDEGLAGERTFLAWNRSALAVVVCAAVLLRHVWPLRGADQGVALGLITLATVLWAIALLLLTLRSGPLMAGVSNKTRIFRLMTAATLILALVGFVASFAAS